MARSTAAGAHSAALRCRASDMLAGAIGMRIRSMHPHLRRRRQRRPADPGLVRHRRDLAEVVAQARASARAPSPRPRASSRRPGRHLLAAGADGGARRRAVRRSRASGDGRNAVPAGRAARRCCRPAPIASPMRRTMRGSRRSPSRSAPIASRATARRERQGRRASCCRTASTATSSRASSKASRSPATSSTRRPTTWARPSSRPPRARSPSSMARNSASIVGDDLLKQNFPLIHAVGRAADRARRG